MNLYLKNAILLVLFCIVFAGKSDKPKGGLRRFVLTDSTATERHGDTLFTYRIWYDHLRHHYRRALSATSVFCLRANDTTLRASAFLTNSGYIFFLDRDEVKHFIDSAHPPFGIHHPRNIDADSKYTGDMGNAISWTELLMNCRLRIIESKTGRYTGPLLIEECRGHDPGRNFSLLQGGDTVRLFSLVPEWMRR